MCTAVSAISAWPASAPTGRHGRARGSAPGTKPLQGNEALERRHRRYVARGAHGKEEVTSSWGDAPGCCIPPVGAAERVSELRDNAIGWHNSRVGAAERVSELRG